MIEPVALHDFFITFLSAAMVIICGAGYAALFASARLKGHSGLMAWAYFFYVLLALAVFVLADAANLSGPWNVVTAVMLAGYLLAPHAIWHICASTHDREHGG